MLPALTDESGGSWLYGCASVAEVMAAILDLIPGETADSFAALGREHGYELWNRWLRREAGSLSADQSALLLACDLERYLFGVATERARRTRSVAAYGPRAAEEIQAEWEARIGACDRLHERLKTQAELAKEKAELAETMQPEDYGWAQQRTTEQVADADTLGRVIHAKETKEPITRGVSIATGDGEDRRKR